MGEEVMGSNATETTSTTTPGGSTSSKAGGSTSSMAPGGGSNMSSTTVKGGTKKVEGNVEFKVGTMADCDKLKASAKYAETLCEKIVGFMGLGVSFKSKCAITTTCSTRRRLAEERRLTVNANSGYAVSGLTANQASNGSAAIATKSVTEVTTALQAARAADP